MSTAGIWSRNIIHRRSTHFILFIIGLILISSLNPLKVQGQGNLLITPSRVVFEGNKRTQELNLANTGQDTARYNVSFVQYRMKEDGSFEEITTPDPGQNFADKYIRFFPRSVLLGPNESQVVKMQLTRTDLLIPGEYRSHIYFRAVPNEKALGEEVPVKDSSSIAVRLVPIFGITIPAIIRIGQSTMKVSFSDLKLDISRDSIPLFYFTFNRSGNMSVYGDLKVEHISTKGKTAVVGIVKSISVFTPNTIRKSIMALDKKAGVDYHSGTLRLTYFSKADTKPETYAEAELKLQ